MQSYSVYPMGKAGRTTNLSSMLPMVTTVEDIIIIDRFYIGHVSVVCL